MSPYDLRGFPQRLQWGRNSHIKPHERDAGAEFLRAVQRRRPHVWMWAGLEHSVYFTCASVYRTKANLRIWLEFAWKMYSVSEQQGNTRYHLLLKTALWHILWQTNQSLFVYLERPEAVLRHSNGHVCVHMYAFMSERVSVCIHSLQLTTPYLWCHISSCAKRLLWPIQRCPRSVLYVCVCVLVRCHLPVTVQQLLTCEAI